MGRAIVSFLFALLLVGVLAGLGAEAYQAGVAQGIVDAGRFPAGATVPVVGGYGHTGFGFLGLVFPLLFLFLIFGVIRAAFSRGRGWGSGWDKGGMSEGGPTSWREDREQRMADMHRRMHEADGGTEPASGGPTGK